MKICLIAAQLENKINYLGKNEIDINSIKEIKENNKTILEIQQKFKSEKHNIFTEERLI